MPRQVIDRRQFLTLPLALFLAPLARAQAAVEAHRAPYGVDVSLLYGALTYRVEGTLTETIDRPRGRYDVAIAGEGDGAHPILPGSITSGQNGSERESALLRSAWLWRR